MRRNEYTGFTDLSYDNTLLSERELASVRTLRQQCCMWNKIAADVLWHHTVRVSMILSYWWTWTKLRYIWIVRRNLLWTQRVIVQVAVSTRLTLSASVAMHGPKLPLFVIFKARPGWSVDKRFHEYCRMVYLALRSQRNRWIITQREYDLVLCSSHTLHKTMAKLDYSWMILFPTRAMQWKMNWEMTICICT